MNHTSIEIIRSKRRSMSIEIRPDLRVILRAPLWVTDQTISRFLDEKSTWIESKKALIQKRTEEENRQTMPAFCREEIEELKRVAAEKIPARTAYFSQLVKADYGKISIRCQRSLWGSCSAKGNLSFNCLLVLCPDDVLDYVIVHELCHRKYFNHSKQFWAEVASVMPQYLSARNWLKKNGNGLISRIKNFI